MQNLQERTGAAEELICSLEDTLYPLCATVRSVMYEMMALKAKLDYLENQSHRNNVRFVGFPEHSEGAHPEQFLYTWLQELHRADSLPCTVVIEGEHRTPPCPPPLGSSPRSIVTQIINFQDKLTILHLAREKWGYTLQ